MNVNHSQSINELQNSAVDIGPEVDKVLALIATAGAHLEEGRMIDLTALDSRVEGLCTMLHGVPTDVARGHIGVLEDLIVALDGLNADINQRVRALTLKPAPAQAASAYSRAES
jgi:hypothetical protein